MAWIISLSSGILIFAFGAAMDWFVLGQRGPLAALAISNTLSGLLACGIALIILRSERQRARQMQHRIETLNEVNDQVRNTLQGLAFSIARIQSPREAGELQEAINRIRWVLTDVLPKVEPSYRPFEGSARKAGLGAATGAERP